MSAGRYSVPNAVVGHMRRPHPSRLIVEQALDRGSDELCVFLANRRQAGSMPPIGADWQQLCIAHLLHFEPVILDLEVKIGIAGHDKGFSSNRTQRRIEVAAIDLVV